MINVVLRLRHLCLDETHVQQAHFPIRPVSAKIGNMWINKKASKATLSNSHS